MPEGAASDGTTNVPQIDRSSLVGVLAVASPALLARRRPIARKPPALGPAPALKLPAIQKRQLSNGLPVWIVELHEVPVVQVNLRRLQRQRRRSRPASSASPA